MPLNDPTTYGSGEPYMSADYIAQAKGNFEPQRSNNGMIIIDDMPGAEGAQEVFALAVDTFPLPKQQNGVIEVDYLNEKRKVAGKATVDAMDIVLKDFIDKSTAMVLWAWRCQVYNPWTGQVGLAHHYKKTATSYLFGPEGSYVRSWKVYGLWPSNMDPGEIDMAGEDVLKITLSCECDKVILQPDVQVQQALDIMTNGGKMNVSAVQNFIKGLGGTQTLFG